MLTRRNFLTTIAAAPLARFCKTEPVEVPMWIDRHSGVVWLDEPLIKSRLKTVRYNGTIHVQRFHLKLTAVAPDRDGVLRKIDDIRYNLPQGTLG